MPRLRVCAIALAAVLPLCPSAWAGPTETLQELFAAINTVLADPETEDRPLERVARIRPLVAAVSDVTSAATTALERAWESRTPSERVEFVTLFAELIERAYVIGLAGRGSVSAGVEVGYRAEFVEGDEALVQTAFRGRRGGDIVVEYRMTLVGERWRVRDLVVDGVSTIENYRAQFRRILGRSSYDDLVSQIRAKLSEDTYIFTRSAGPGPIALAPAVPFEIAAVDDTSWRQDALAVPVEVATVATRPEASPSPETGPSVEPRPVPTVPRITYWVQLATFQTAEKARRMAAEVAGGVVVPSLSGQRFYVRVGPFAERAQASLKLRELQALGDRPYVAEARD